MAKVHSQHAEGVSLGGFVCKAAHDIANPLNAILMNAELVKLMLERGQISAAAESLQRLMGDCKRASRLLRDMGAFGSDLQSDDRARIDLRELIDDAAAAAMMAGVQARVSTHVDLESIAIFASRTAFERIAVALLRNADEAGASAIEIRASQESGLVTISFCDDGSGMEHELREKAFDAFFTTRRDAGNSGLGLTLVRALTSEHNGNIAIEPNHGPGTCILLRFPADASARLD